MVDVLVAAALNEIASNGKQGLRVEALWSAIHGAAVSVELDVHDDDAVRSFLWQALLRLRELRFVKPSLNNGSNNNGDDDAEFTVLDPQTHEELRSFEAAQRAEVSLVAAEHLIDSCIGLYDLKFSEAGLSSVQRDALQRLCKAKHQGITQNELAKAFGIKGNKLFYIVRSLETRGLLVRQSTLVRTEKGEKTNPIVNTNLIHLSRYAKNLSLKSQQRFEIRKSNTTDNNDCVNMTPVMEGFGDTERDDILIKDDLPALQAICDKLEEADGKVLVVADLKVSLGYRFTVGHREWRRISKRLIDAGLVEIFDAKVDKKVVPCIKLLKRFDPRIFSSKAAMSCIHNADTETTKGKKRGQITDQLFEIPVDHQIYDMIDNVGIEGTTFTEIFRSLGLNNKRNYHRIVSMFERGGLQSMAENHKRNVMYRVWTKEHFNSLNHMTTSNAPQDSQIQQSIQGFEFNSGRDLTNHSYGVDSDQNLNSGRHQNKQLSCKGENFNAHFNHAFENQQQRACSLAEINSALVSTSKQQSQLPSESISEAEKVHKVHPVRSADPYGRGGHRYLCLSATTSRLQREERIVQRLKEEKFILRVELHRWLEDLEKGKNSTMDRKTLNRTLQKLTSQGYCKVVTVSVPVLTNFTQKRTTEVVLEPDLELIPEIVNKIHEKLRSFDMQSRGHGICRSKKDEPVPNLTGIKRKISTEPEGSQTIRAESLRANGYIPAKMVRVKMLHVFLWSYVRNFPDWDAGSLKVSMSSDSNFSCKLFDLDAAVSTMPLELFLQVIGSEKDMTEACSQGVRLGDLPKEEFEQLMDKNASGRLSGLIDVIRRLKLLRLVMLNGDRKEVTPTAAQAVLTYALYLRPYIEEPLSGVVPSLAANAVNALDYKPKHRFDFILRSMDEVNAYWRTLETYFGNLDPTAAVRAFPGSTVPELFVQRSWASVRVMSVEQRKELMKRIANDDLGKRITVDEVDQIANDLNLTRDQVFLVCYQKNRKARLMGIQMDGMKTDRKGQRPLASKRKRGTKDAAENDISKKNVGSSCVYSSETTSGQQMLPDRNESPEIEEPKNKRLCMEENTQGVEIEEDNDEDESDGTFINHISRLKPTRIKRFTWTEALDRTLIVIYARRRATMGPHNHRVDWPSIPNLPAPANTCCRRIMAFKQIPAVRKALMKLCELLKSRYLEYMQEIQRKQGIDGENEEISQVQDESSIEVSTDENQENITGLGEMHPPWDDFDDPTVSDAVEKVLKYKYAGRLGLIKRSGSSAVVLLDRSESAAPEKRPGNNVDLSSFIDSSEGSGLLDVSKNASSTVISNGTQPCQAYMAGKKKEKYRVPKRLQVLLDKDGFDIPKTVLKSLAVANAAELIKLVFLNSTTNTEVPTILVSTLQQYSEFDVYAAFNFLRTHGLVVVGHGAQPFVLSSKFFHKASASPFPVGTGDRASKFSKWLSDNQKELEENRMILPAEQECGDLFKLLTLVAFGEITISPVLPCEGIGEPEDRKAWKLRLEKEKHRKNPMRPKSKTPWSIDRKSCTRRERGFPGIEVHVNRAMIPTAELISRNFIDKEPLAELSSHLSVSPTNDCAQYMDLLTSFVKDYLSSQVCSEETEHIFDSSYFVAALDAIEKSGEEGLRLEELAHSCGIDENNIARVDAIVEALQAFNYIKKVNAFDHIRLITSSRSSKYFLHIHDKEVHPSELQPPIEQHTNNDIEICLEDGIYYTRSVIPTTGNSEQQISTQGMDHPNVLSKVMQSSDVVMETPEFGHEGGQPIQIIDQCGKLAGNVQNVPERDHEDDICYTTSKSEQQNSSESTDHPKVRESSDVVMEEPECGHESGQPFQIVDQCGELTGHVRNIPERDHEDDIDCTESVISTTGKSGQQSSTPESMDHPNVQSKVMESSDVVMEAPECGHESGQAFQIIDQCSEFIGNVQNISSQKVNSIELESQSSRSNIHSRKCVQGLPILPWLSADGQIKTSMYRALTRRVLGIIMQQPGIAEDDLVKDLDILNPQTAKNLLELLQSEGHISVRILNYSDNALPSLLKGLVVANCTNQQSEMRRHYYANSSCIQLL